MSKEVKSEEPKESVETETEISTQLGEVQAQQPQDGEQQPEEKEETPEQINWKKFREGRKRDRQERERIEREAKAKEEENIRMKEMMSSLLQAQNQSPMTTAETEQAVASFDPNDIPTNADVQTYINTHVEKIVESRVQKIIDAQEKRLQQEAAVREQREMPQRLQKDCPDFDNVCSEENIDYLEYHFPEVAQAYNAMPDGLNKWKGVYSVIKKLVPNHQSTRDTAAAKQNAMKPQSMSSPGVATTGDSAPAYLDSSKRKDNWARMQRIMKGGG